MYSKIENFINNDNVCVYCKNKEITDNFLKVCDKYSLKWFSCKVASWQNPFNSCGKESNGIYFYYDDQHFNNNQKFLGWTDECFEEYACIEAEDIIREDNK